MYPYQHDAERRMTELANRFLLRGDAPNEREEQMLAQLARELLLAQSSDWAFQIYQGTTVQYSTRRFESHIQRFDLIANMLESGEPDQEVFDEIASRDNIFSEIDWRVYATADPRPSD